MKNFSSKKILKSNLDCNPQNEKLIFEKRNDNTNKKVLSEKEKQAIKSLYNITKEENRRKNTKIACYNTGEKVHKKQLLFHKSQKRNRWVFGGNRSGKSECGAVEVVWIARGNHPYRKNKKNTSGWVVSLSSRVQKDVAQSKILSYLDKSWIDDIVMVSGNKTSPEYGTIERILVKNVFGGISSIGFKSCEEGRDKFQGSSLDYVWFDEEPPKDIYDECVMRIIDKKGDIFGTMTPLKGLTFVYDEIYLNPSGDNEVFCIFMEWADNPFIDESEIKRLNSIMGKTELESRRFGRFVDNGAGLVYSEFNPEIHIIEPFSVPTYWQENISIDPGLTNPLSAHWYAVDGDGNIFVIAEHYKAGENIDYHADKIKQISEKLSWKKNHFGGYSALIDTASLQKTLASPKSVAELFYERNIFVNTKVNKDLFSGISRIKSLLCDGDGKSHLFIFSNCVNMIREIKGYRWGNEDAPVKKDDHALDELRYFVMSRPEPNIVEEKKSIIQLDKEKLYRRIKNNKNF